MNGNANKGQTTAQQQTADAVDLGSDSPSSEPPQRAVSPKWDPRGEPPGVRAKSSASQPPLTLADLARVELGWGEAEAEPPWTARVCGRCGGYLSLFRYHRCEYPEAPPDDAKDDDAKDDDAKDDDAKDEGF